MKSLILKMLIFSVLMVKALPVLAQAEYDLLPRLDGKIDHKTVNPDYVIKKGNLVKETRSFTSKKTDITTNSGKKLSTANEQEKHNDSIVTFDSPKLDKLTPSLKKNHRSEALQFARYEKDLNEMLFQLIHLKNTLKEGTNIQVFSAGVTTTKLMNDIFKNKYAESYESQLESYKLVQKIVNSAVYVRDYWINSNKIQYNQHGIPDKIIQTKFLVITTAVEKLEELMDLETVLTQE